MCSSGNLFVQLRTEAYGKDWKDGHFKVSAWQYIWAFFINHSIPSALNSVIHRDPSVTHPSSAHWSFTLTFNSLFDVQCCLFLLMDSIATVGSGPQIRIILHDAKISICKCMFVSQIVKRTEHGLLKISLKYCDLMFGLAFIVFCKVKIAQAYELGSSHRSAVSAMLIGPLWLWYRLIMMCGKRRTETLRELKKTQSRLSGRSLRGRKKFGHWWTAVLTLLIFQVEAESVASLNLFAYNKRRSPFT